MNVSLNIKTLDESRQGRVGLTLVVGGHAGDRVVDLSRENARVSLTIDGEQSTERLYTAEQVGDAQASEAELVAAPLRRRIDELVGEVNRRISEVTSYVIQRDEALDRVSALETERDDLKRQAAEFNRQCNEAVTNMEAAQQARADQNRAWAERTEKHLADAVKAGDKARADLAAAQLQIDELAHQLGFVKAANKRRAEKLWAIGNLVHGPSVNRSLELYRDHPLCKTVTEVRKNLITPPTPPAGE